MQELRSTDILDKEIQADARKKAERMLAKTDSECEKLIASVESDIEKAAEEKRLQEVKFKSDNPIKEIQARNHMRKSPADEYFERMKLAAAEVIKPKK